jgi:hypothetical protein
LPTKIDEQFALTQNPTAGDVLSLYDSKSATAAVFYHSATQWVDVSQSFFNNDGATVYPDPSTAKRVLTWRSSDLRVPTWVLENTYKKSKQFGTVWDGRHDIFVRHFVIAGNRQGGSISVASSSQV